MVQSTSRDQKFIEGVTFPSNKTHMVSRELFGTSHCGQVIWPSIKHTEGLETSKSIIVTVTRRRSQMYVKVL